MLNGEQGEVARALAADALQLFCIYLVSRSRGIKKSEEGLHSRVSHVCIS